MFNTIRSMVGQKATFMETASILIDDATGIPDDLFAEDVDDENRGIIDIVDEAEDNDSEHKKNDDDDDGDHEYRDAAILSDETPPEEFDADADVMGANIDTSDVPDTSDTEDKLPKLSDSEDLLSITIDMATGISPDILPVPPINAGDAISEDPLSTRISDGFDASDVSTTSEVTIASILNEVEPGAKTESTLFAEAITLDAEEPSNEPKADAEVPSDTSKVTDAVMDKVAESEISDENVDEQPDENALQLKLQDRLDKFQKDIINLKDMVKKGLSQ